MFKRYLALPLTLLSMNIYAAAVPPNLMFEGKPIDSICFTQGGKGNLIDLNTCGFKAKNYIVKDEDDNFKKNGFIGNNWEDPDYNEQGSSYYKFYPAGGSKYWIETISNYGGSGVFSGFSLVERKDSNTLTSLHIRGGDRCYGGINDAEVKGHQLTFSKNLTSYHLIELGDKNGNPTLDQNDIASCMACCMAEAIYIMNPNDTQPKLLRVEINADSFYLNEGKRGICFNKLLKTYLDKSPTFSPDMLKTFSQDFRRTCLLNI